MAMKTLGSVADGLDEAVIGLPMAQNLNDTIDQIIDIL